MNEKNLLDTKQPSAQCVVEAITVMMEEDTFGNYNNIRIPESPPVLGVSCLFIES